MPRIETNNKPAEHPFRKATEQPAEHEENNVNTMSNNTTTPEAAEQSNSAVSIADLYAEMEKTLIVKAESKNSGVTKAIRDIVDATFAATGKDKLLLSAVVAIVQKQTGKQKLYNLVRSVANSKSEHAKYSLVTVDGRTYIHLNE